MRARARDLGIHIGRLSPGRWNAISAGGWRSGRRSVWRVWAASGVIPAATSFSRFSTGNRGLAGPAGPGETRALRMIPNEANTPLFEATAEATEEAIVNALCMATTTTGIEGRVAHAIPLDRLRQVMRDYRRLTE